MPAKTGTRKLEETAILVNKKEAEPLNKTNIHIR